MPVGCGPAHAPQQIEGCCTGQRAAALQTLEDLAAQYGSRPGADARVVRLVRLIQEHRGLSKYLNDFSSSIERRTSESAFATPGCQARARPLTSTGNRVLCPVPFAFALLACTCCAVSSHKSPVAPPLCGCLHMRPVCELARLFTLYSRSGACTHRPPQAGQVELPPPATTAPSPTAAAGCSGVRALDIP